MRVMCINANYKGNKGLKKPTVELIEGEVYNVLKECLCRNSDGAMIPAYILQEMPEGGWERFRFIPLSEISETTFERNYNTQTT